MLTYVCLDSKLYLNIRSLDIDRLKLAPAEFEAELRLL